MYQEINFDGLVGPTHNFAGLSEGNIASTSSRARASRPRDAALQGLQKMKALADWGIPQAVLPPLQRPAVSWLRSFGLTGGDDAAVITRAAREAPQLLAACCSASSMWTANAATMTPSCDTPSGRAHFTPANLSSKLHRAIEAPETQRVFQTLFADPEHFVVHPPLPGGEAMRDEGAANHTRLSANASSPGTHLFVYGASNFDDQEIRPTRFPARQTREASAAIARHHQIPPERTVLIQQNPAAIDAGVFHNDVIAVGHQNVLFYHELAFAAGTNAIHRITGACPHPLVLLPVSTAEVDLATAVNTYLFNSQIVTRPDGDMMIIAPSNSAENPATAACLARIISAPDNPIIDVKFFNLRQSMRNGGGPACLRQRVQLNPTELAAVKGRVMMDNELFTLLSDWVSRRYREEIQFDDLADPQLLIENRAALDELTQILQLGSLYGFQR